MTSKTEVGDQTDRSALPRLVLLIPEQGDENPVSLQIPEGVSSIGTEGTIVLTGYGVLPEHCEVRNMGDIVMQHSDGEVYVNGKKLQGPMPLGQGSRIRIGSHFFRLDNPHRKQWVNPPGFAYAEEEFNREQDLQARREKRSAEIEKRQRRRSRRNKRADADDGLHEMKPPAGSPMNGKSPRTLSFDATAGSSATPPSPFDIQDPLTISRSRTPRPDGEGRLPPAAPIQVENPPVLVVDEAHSPTAVDLADRTPSGLRKELRDLKRANEKLQKRNQALEEEMAHMAESLKKKHKEDMVTRGENLVNKVDEVVKEAQHYTFAVCKPYTFGAKLKAIHDDRNVEVNQRRRHGTLHSMQSEACVEVKDTRDANLVVTMELNPFMVVLSSMRQVYNDLEAALKDGEQYVLDICEDPWEQLFQTPQVIGSSSLLWTDLLHCVSIEELKSGILSSSGKKIGLLTWDAVLCLQPGVPVTEDDEIFVDADEFEEFWLTKSFHAIFNVKEISGLEPDKYTTLSIEYDFFTQPDPSKSQTVRVESGAAQVDLGYTKEHTQTNVDSKFLDYMENCQIQVRVMGVVPSPNYVQITSEDARTRQLIHGMRKKHGSSAHRPSSAPAAGHIPIGETARLARDKEILEGKVKHQDLTITELQATASELQEKLEKSASTNQIQEGVIQAHEQTIQELKSKKRELNNLLKSEKEKFLVRQKELKQRVQTLKQENMKLLGHNPATSWRGNEFAKLNGNGDSNQRNQTLRPEVVHSL